MTAQWVRTNAPHQGLGFDTQTELGSFSCVKCACCACVDILRVLWFPRQNKVLHNRLPSGTGIACNKDM